MRRSIPLIVVLSFLLLYSSCQEPPASTATTPGPVAQGQPLDAPVTATPATTGLQRREAPTDPQERAKLAQEAPQPTSREGYQSVTFDQLSAFDYSTDGDGKLLPSAQLPNEIAALEGQSVAVSGYGVPIEFQGEKVSSLILVRNQLLCCYGEEPKLNEWVFVDIEPPTNLVADVPITLYGTFYASPDEEEGQVVSLYRMAATSLETMK